MKTRDLQALRERMRRFDNDRLRSILTDHRDDYTSEAVIVAAAELAERGFSIQRLMTEHREEEQRARALAERLMAMVHQAAADLTCCHLCGARDCAATIPFGLGLTVDQERDWLKTLTISAVTLPLLGLIVTTRHKSVRVVSLALVLCSECVKKKRWLGTWNLSEGDYSRHPAWAPAQALGFRDFLHSSKLTKLAANDITPDIAGGSV